MRKMCRGCVLSSTFYAELSFASDLANIVGKNGNMLGAIGCVS